MLLTVDVGNTNIVLGLYQGDRCVHFWRLSSEPKRTSDEYAILIYNLLNFSQVEREKIKGIVLGSVVPVLTITLEAAFQRVLGQKPYRVTHHSKLSVENRYGAPHEVGIDRLANAVGGVALYGAPLIVVDLGTAVSLDTISKNLEYFGGMILPGIEMSAEALARRTARLPLVSAVFPERVIGRSTVESIRSGIFNGLVGAVDHCIEQIWSELGYQTQAVATGGLAGTIIGRSKHIRQENSELTLLGLKAIWELNCGESS